MSIFQPSDGDYIMRGLSLSWAAKGNRATNDPQRIERRKTITPAMTVPRQSGGETGETNRSEA